MDNTYAYTVTLGDGFIQIYTSNTKRWDVIDILKTNKMNCNTATYQVVELLTSKGFEFICEFSGEPFTDLQKNLSRNALQTVQLNKWLN